MIDLNQLATLLDGTMHNAGIMDDYDEVIGDHFDNDPEGAKNYHKDVIAGILFINGQLGTDYSIDSFEDTFSEIYNA